jgi:hypothetical protein
VLLLPILSRSFFANSTDLPFSTTKKDQLPSTQALYLFGSAFFDIEFSSLAFLLCTVDKGALYLLATVALLTLGLLTSSSMILVFRKSRRTSSILLSLFLSVLWQQHLHHYW